MLRYSLKANSALQTIYTPNLACLRQTLRNLLQVLTVQNYLQNTLLHKIEHTFAEKGVVFRVTKTKIDV